MRITNRQMVRDCVEYKKRPFSSKDIFEDTGICLKTIQNVIKEFVTAGIIKEIGQEGGYKRYRKVRQIKPILTDRPAQSVIDDVRQYVNTELTQQQIADKLGISRSLVAMAVKELKTEMVIITHQFDPLDVSGKILQYVESGKTYSSIAIELNVSVPTVKRAFETIGKSPKLPKPEPSNEPKKPKRPKKTYTRQYL